MITRHALLLCALSALLASGCALTNKSSPIVPRYFSPELPGGAVRSARGAPGAAVELRLGRVSGASYLDERIVYRDSAFELGYYSERLWTQAPDEYLKRRLARVLFEERGIRRVVAGAAATLDVDLVAFEEIRAPRRVARVQVIVKLMDQRLVRWEETLTAEQPLAVKNKGDLDAELVEALGVALRTIVDRIADRVTTELAAPAAAPATASTAP